MTTTIDLVGGLGNQFFGYFAGMAHSYTFQKAVSFNLLGVNESLGTNETIESIYLPQDFCRKKVASNISLKLHPRRYRSTQLGYDQKILNRSSLKVINGYFQSFKYFDIFKQHNPGWTPLLKKESSYFKEMDARIEELKPISIHLRRGDYRKLKDSFGLINSQYYIKCVQLAVEEFGQRRVLIFGDEYSENNSLNEELKSLGYKSDVILPDSDSPPIESLLLISRCAINITGNSTFGWWGVAFNSNPLAVYAPKKWFKSIEDPAELIPPHWVTVQSSWE
jgi:hypothetical protein